MVEDIEPFRPKLKIEDSDSFVSLTRAVSKLLDPWAVEDPPPRSPSEPNGGGGKRGWIKVIVAARFARIHLVQAPTWSGVSTGSTMGPPNAVPSRELSLVSTMVMGSPVSKRVFR